MNRKISVLFFDAGNTLVYLSPSLEETFQKVCLGLGALLSLEGIRAGYRKAEDLLMQRDPHNNQKQFFSNQEWNETILQEAGVGQNIETLAKQVSAKFEGIHSQEAPAWKSDSHVFDLLDQLKGKGYRLGVISNCDGSVEATFKEQGLLHYFDCIVDSGLVGVAKPDPKIFEIGLSRLECRPEQAVHVGDRYEYDCVGARAAGVKPLLFDPTDRYPHADCTRLTALEQIWGHLG